MRSAPFLFGVLHCLRADAQKGRYFLVSCALTLADEGIRTFRAACALTLADFGSCRSDAFLSFRTGPERTLGPGPLWTFPAPEAKKERLLRLWTPPLPPRVQPHVLLGSVVQWGLNGLITGLQGPHQDSQLDSIEIRSTPRMQRNVSDLYSMKVQRICARSKSDTYAQHLHLGEAEKSNTNRCTIRCKRAPKQKEPLNMEMAPVNQHTIGEMELVPSAVGPSPIEQRCKSAKVRTPRSRVESRGGEGPPSSSSGAWRFLRGPGPRVLLGPVRKDNKIMDLQDPKSASVSAQTECDYSRELAEGELASSLRGLPARKPKAHNKSACAGKHTRFV